MVACLEGTVVVHSTDREPLALRPLEMAYIPAGIDFDVANESDNVATLMLVYVRKLESDEQNHSHNPSSAPDDHR